MGSLHASQFPRKPPSPTRAREKNRTGLGPHPPLTAKHDSARFRGGRQEVWNLERSRSSRVARREPPRFVSGRAVSCSAVPSGRRVLLEGGAGVAVDDCILRASGSRCGTSKRRTVENRLPPVPQVGGARIEGSAEYSITWGRRRVPVFSQPKQSRMAAIRCEQPLVDSFLARVWPCPNLVHRARSPASC